MDHWDDPLEEFRPFEQQEYYVTSLYRMSRLKCSTWIAPFRPEGAVMEPTGPGRSIRQDCPQ